MYFAVKNPPFTPPLLLQGSDFRKNVWKILLKIPFGETKTYKEITEQIARQRGISKMSAQAVGNAGHNPISLIIPCHPSDRKR
ncbi:methylated-DNA--[protein]-cysteine S-methyltransferase [Helicobacter typhlonius]|uniref:methylated-DNA--[protein]-cysteine S-methyltransferase n=1 Tax=Helicobacter typhlonius TaxID=76936 RepID=UPI002FDF8F7E